MLKSAPSKRVIYTCFDARNRATTDRSTIRRFSRTTESSRHRNEHFYEPNEMIKRCARDRDQGYRSNRHRKHEQFSVLLVNCFSFNCQTYVTPTDWFFNDWHRKAESESKIFEYSCRCARLEFLASFCEIKGTERRAAFNVLGSAFHAALRTYTHVHACRASYACTVTRIA